MNAKNAFNPTPISKLLVTIFLAFNLVTDLNEICIVMTIGFIALFFALNNRVRAAIKIVAFYALVIIVSNNAGKLEYAFVKNYVLTIVVAMKLFLLPLLAGKFLIDTSDVSSLIVSFEKMRFPEVMIIPMAVMFRYFPAFKDDRKNIKMAMRMRGITFKNPIRYLEYVSVPLLISATNIADDISKAAETKCIADPCEKTRYFEVKFSLTDAVFMLGILALNILGRVYA
ncbi:MAG: cobalt ABC transporter permease [Chloroflexi bacterium]|nr:MAG: cobalt ABC transporter permease [Chloroflexota bacterium]PIE81031.1 MAG: cobalt ABC transporter permease [Chloroflexota bacterium]